MRIVCDCGKEALALAVPLDRDGPLKRSWGIYIHIDADRDFDPRIKSAYHLLIECTACGRRLIAVEDGRVRTSTEPEAA